MTRELLGIVTATKGEQVRLVTVTERHRTALRFELAVRGTERTSFELDAELLDVLRDAIDETRETWRAAARGRRE